MKKKMLSLLMALALVLGLIPGFAAQTAQAADDDLWTDYVLSSEVNQLKTVVYGDKTYYAIGKADELAAFAKAVRTAKAGDDILSKNIALTADIDLSAHVWTTMGKWTNYDKSSGVADNQACFQSAYKGDLFGNGYTITGVRLTAASNVHASVNTGQYVCGTYNNVYFLCTQGKIENVRFKNPSIQIPTAITYVNTAFCTKSDEPMRGDWIGLLCADSITNIEVENADVDVQLQGHGIGDFGCGMFNFILASKPNGDIMGYGSNISNVYIKGGDFALTPSTDGETKENACLDSNLINVPWAERVSNVVVTADSYTDNDNTPENWTGRCVFQYYEELEGEKDVSNCYTTTPLSTNYYYDYLWEEAVIGKVEYVKSLSTSQRYDVLSTDSTAWTLKDGELVFGENKLNPGEPKPDTKPDPKPDNVELWTDHASEVAPVKMLYNGEYCYAIGTAEELAWIAKQVQNGKLLDKSIVLTKDIDLSDYVWPTMGRFVNYSKSAGHHQGCFQSLYTGNLYGDGYTIEGVRLTAASNVPASFNAGEALCGTYNNVYFLCTQGKIENVRFEEPSIQIPTAITYVDTDFCTTSDDPMRGDFIGLLCADSITSVEVENADVDLQLQGHGTGDFGCGMFNFIFAAKQGEGTIIGYGSEISNVYIKGGDFTLTPSTDGETKENARLESNLISAMFSERTNNVVVTANSYTDNNNKPKNWTWRCVFGYYDGLEIDTKGTINISNCYTTTPLSTNYYVDDLLYEEAAVGKVEYMKHLSDSQIYIVLSTDSSAWKLENGKLVFGKYTPNTTYDITLNVGANGTASVDKTSAEAGETITLTVTPNEGYEAKVTSNDVTFSGYSFTMPAKDVTITVTFTKEVPGPVEGWSFISGALYGATMAKSYQVAIFTPDSSFTDNGILLSGYKAFRRVDKDGTVQFLAIVASNETANTLNAKLTGVSAANEELASSYATANRGDLNKDGACDDSDTFYMIDNAWGATMSDEWLVLSADLDFSGTFDLDDFMVVADLAAGSL